MANAGLGGVCDLTDEAIRSRWMDVVSLDEVWGIGSASQWRLKAMGCTSVADVRDLDPKLARRA